MILAGAGECRSQAPGPSSNVRVHMEASDGPWAGELYAIASVRMLGRTDLLGMLGEREGKDEGKLAVPCAQSNIEGSYLLSDAYVLGA